MTNPTEWTAERVSAHNAAADPKNTEHTITVAKLRSMLADLPSDAVVVLAKDPEGNGFSPLADLGAAWYVPECTWAGEVYDIGADADGEVFEPRPGDLYAIVFEPVN